MSDKDRDMGTLAEIGAQEDAAIGREILGLEDARAWQVRLVEGMLRAVSIVGLPVAAAGTYDSYVNQEFWTLPFYWGSYG
ncbi:MAG: hypothetical protein JXA93_18730, partial [Anaerolineae bacterium]|nr:hypothetical protein [Anaerolineae bacterium]